MRTPRNQAYRDLMTEYIENIGWAERLATADDLFFVQRLPVNGDRAVGQVVEKNGSWSVFMLKVSRRPRLRFVRSQWGAFPSRQIAEIVARYRMAVFNSSTQGKKVDHPGCCWN